MKGTLAGTNPVYRSGPAMLGSVAVALVTMACASRRTPPNDWGTYPFKYPHRENGAVVVGVLFELRVYVCPHNFALRVPVAL